MVETRTDKEAQDKVWEMIRDINVATMVTIDADGQMRGRPMVAAKLKEFEGVLWFFTRHPSPKTQEIKQDERVLLAYSEPSDQNYVSISGTATVVRDVDKQKAFWSEPMRTWFPGGAEDPSCALLKVDVEGAEYWDAPSSALVYAYGYVKARLTGESPKGADNDKVAFKNPA